MKMLRAGALSACKDALARRGELGSLRSMLATTREPFIRPLFRQWMPRLCLVLAPWVWGCGAVAPAPGDAPPLSAGEDGVTVTAVRRLSWSEHVATIDVDCDEDRREVRDGLDDDCDGGIDEGLGDAADIVVEWRDGSALRASLVSDAGETLVQAAAECGAEPRVGLSVTTLSAGDATLRVERVAGCGTDEATVAAVSIAVFNADANVGSLRVGTDAVDAGTVRLGPGR